MKKLLIALVCVLAFSSCAPTIKDLSLYQKQYLTKSKYLPSKDELKGKTPTMVVFPLEVSNNTARRSSLDKSVASNIENILTKNKLVKLVDRRAAKILEKEIKLSELNNTGSYKGPQISDYAISGSISDAGFNKKYIAASSYLNPDSGQYVNTPAKFRYSANVSGNIKVYKLPSMNVDQNIEFRGSATRSENVQTQGGVRIGAVAVGGTQSAGKSKDDNLVRKAAQNAIANIEVEIKNALSARGYVLEKRVNEDGDLIFKVTVGSRNGIEHGDDVEIVGKFDVSNPITNDYEVEKRSVAKGVISNIIQPRFAWIIVKDKKTAAKIRLGDVVKLKYKRGLW